MVQEHHLTLAFAGTLWRDARTAVTQNASQGRGMADMPWHGLCSRIAWSTASTKVLTKGAGCAITIALLMDCRVSGHNIGTVSMVGT